MNKLPVSIPGKFLSAYEEFKYSTSYKIKSPSYNLYTIFWAYIIRMHSFDPAAHIAFIKRLLTVLRSHKMHSNFTIAMEEFITTKYIEPLIKFASNIESEMEIITTLVMFIENFINENENELMCNNYYREYMKGKKLSKTELINCMKSNKFHSLIYYVLAIPMGIKIVFRIGTTEHQYPKEDKKPVIYLIICEDVVNILLSETDYNLIYKAKLAEQNIEDESIQKENQDYVGDLNQFSPSKMSFKSENKSPDSAAKRKFVSKFGIMLCSPTAKCSPNNTLTEEIKKSHRSETAESKGENFFTEQAPLHDDILPVIYEPNSPLESPRSKLYPSTITLPSSKKIGASPSLKLSSTDMLSQQSTEISKTRPNRSVDVQKAKSKFSSPFTESASKNIIKQPYYSTVDVVRDSGHKNMLNPKYLEENEEDIEEIALANSMYIDVKCSICNKEIKSETEYMGNGRLFVCAKCFNKNFQKIAKFNGNNEVIFDYGLTIQIVFPKIRKNLFALLSTILGNITPQKCAIKKVELKLSDFLYSECPHCYMGWYAHKKLKVDNRVATFICVMCHKLGLYEIKLSCKHLICSQCFNKNKEYYCHFCSKLPQTAIELLDYSKYDRCSQCHQVSKTIYSCQYGHKICYTCSCLIYNYWTKQYYCKVCNFDCTIHRLDNMLLQKACVCETKVEKDGLCSKCGRELAILEKYYTHISKMLNLTSLPVNCFYCEEKSALLFPFYCNHFGFCAECAIVLKGKFTFMSCIICAKKRNKAFQYLIGDKNML